ncbi:unnamed protein product, partial [Prunus brigantina]
MMQSIIGDIQELLHQFHEVGIDHIYREANMMYMNFLKKGIWFTLVVFGLEIFLRTLHLGLSLICMFIRSVEDLVHNLFSL